MASITVVFLLLAVLSFPAKTSVQALELVDSSSAVKLVQGDSSGSIFCEADSTFEFCKITHLETGRKCLMKAEEDGSSCAEDMRLVYEISDTRCGIRFDGASKMTDEGTYACELIVTRDDGTTETATGTVDVDVYVPATVGFNQDFAAASTIDVDLNSNVLVWCTASGGYPHPDLSAALVDGDSEMAVTGLKEMDDMTKIVEHDDGTADITKVFLLIPHHEDCGRFVRCDAQQVNDEDGENIFEGIYEMRKLMVKFPPQPASSKERFGFQAGSVYPAEVTINFLSNPAPTNNEAIWHINPTKEDSSPPPPGSILVQAGTSSEDSRYEAAPLNITGHEVSATLYVNDPQDDLEGKGFYLHVMTELGEKKYEFSMRKEVLPYYGPSTDGPGGREQNQDSVAMSGGTIAAIVLIIVLIMVGGGVTYWAKVNNKWCFYRGAHTVVPTNARDAEAAAHKAANHDLHDGAEHEHIIKEKNNELHNEKDVDTTEDKDAVKDNKDNNDVDPNKPT